MEKYTIPTGYLFTDTYSRGKLETLSIGDYGKSKNIKADFLGFTNEINGVPNGKCANISEKWVITLSTQYGCTQKCSFCDCPKIPLKGNASFTDLKNQLYNAIKCFPDVKYTDRLNLHYARMGEPAFNSRNVFDFTRWLHDSKRVLQDETGLRVETLHPVFTTSTPTRLKNIDSIIKEWVDIKNNLYNGQAGLQLSINSTDNGQRNKMFNGLSISLEDLSGICKFLPAPLGRKYCLNFAFASDNIIDGNRLASLFNPDNFMCKITPIHNNTACRDNHIETIDGYTSYTPYRNVENNLKGAGFDVLVFIPSMDEERNLVTCGNVVLSGSKINPIV